MKFATLTLICALLVVATSGCGSMRCRGGGPRGPQMAGGPRPCPPGGGGGGDDGDDDGIFGLQTFQTAAVSGGSGSHSPDNI